MLGYFDVPDRYHSMGALSCKGAHRVLTESGQIPIYNEFKKSVKLQIPISVGTPGGGLKMKL